MAYYLVGYDDYYQAVGKSRAFDAVSDYAIDLQKAAVRQYNNDTREIAGWKAAAYDLDNKVNLLRKSLKDSKQTASKYQKLSVKLEKENKEMKKKIKELEEKDSSSLEKKIEELEKEIRSLTRKLSEKVKAMADHQIEKSKLLKKIYDLENPDELVKSMMEEAMNDC